MVFIRPTIIGTRTAARTATDRKLNYISAQISAASRGRAPDLREQIAAVTGPIAPPALRDDEAPALLQPAPADEKGREQATIAERAVAPTPASIAEAEFADGERVTEPAPEPEPAPRIALRSVFFGVHLGSYRSRTAAAAGWRELRDAHPVELDALSVRAAAYDDPERGAFERIIAGPFPSKEDARRLCGTLADRGVYCAVMPYDGVALDEDL